MNKDVQILISAMHQKDYSIFNNSNIRTNALMINQCDKSDVQEIQQNGNLFRIISTTDRGLSKSRNLAVENAQGKFCLICDDDEIFVDDLELKIKEAYIRNPQADIIIFKMSNYKCGLGEKARRLKKLDCLKVSSWQISFRLSSIKGNIYFDTNLGAGTPNGAGEENKFLIDCYKKGMKIYYEPVEIASVAQEKSTWFSGYDKKFFYNRGKTTRYILGLPISFLYAFHFLLFKHKLYKDNITLWQASKYLLKGVFAESIDGKYEQE